MPWVKLVEFLLLIKKSLAKRETHEDMQTLELITDELQHIQTHKNPPERLVGAQCFSKKLLVYNNAHGLPPERTPGSITNVVFANDENPVLIFKSDTGDLVEHAPHDLELATESWWFSQTEHKPPKT